jgi:DUF4097 and DUF4098 domain-containing protein YvlB
MAWPAPANDVVLRISTTSGKVQIDAEPGRAEFSSSSDVVDAAGTPPTVEGGSSSVRLRVPEGTDLLIGSTSGRVTVRGRVGRVSAVTTSGRIDIERAASVDARSRSGRIGIGHADGECRVVSTSGGVTIGRCGDADLTSRSGRIVVSDAHGAVRAACTSGRISVRMAGPHDVAAETVSGSVEVSYPESVHPLVTASSTSPVDASVGCDCTVVARSGSGRVVVTNR